MVNTYGKELSKEGKVETNVKTRKRDFAKGLDRNWDCAEWRELVNTSLGAVE